MTHTVLHIDSSARKAGSTSRDLSARIVERLGADSVVYRDLADFELPHVTEAWIGANYTPADQRSDEQRELLALSDQLVDELVAADTLVIGLPVYNFAPPAALKAWIDLVVRVGRCFQYTESGPEGLLTGKRAIVAFASGGTPVESEIDYAARYLRHILGFVGITDVQFIAAAGLNVDEGAALKSAEDQLAELAA